METIEAEVKKLGDFTKIGNENLKLEEGKQKIVVLGTKNKDGTFVPRHYALQLPNGKWLSKLGIEGPTIIHDELKILMGNPGYDGIIGVYSRPNDAYKNK